MAVALKKTSVMLLPDGGKKSLTICAFVYIQYQSVTDGQICHNNIALWASGPVVKVRGIGGLSPLLPFEPPAIV